MNKYRESSRHYVKLPQFIVTTKYIIEAFKDGEWLPLGDEDGIWRFDDYIQRNEKLAEIKHHNR